jgi:hypothetical protein
MEYNYVNIPFKKFDELFKDFFGIYSKYALEILPVKEYDDMVQQLDTSIGLRFIGTDLDNYNFVIEDKNKYLMAKISYGI